MNTLLVAGIVLLFIGVMLILLSLGEKPKTEVKTGGVVVIGPLPVIFGSDKEAVTIAVVAAIIIMVLTFITFMGH